MRVSRNKASAAFGASGAKTLPEDESTLIRVSRLLAMRGLCSRREADRYIERGWVFADGERITELGTRVSASAKVSLAPEARRQEERLVTLLVNKPVGYVSGQPEAGKRAAVSLIHAGTEWRGTDDFSFEAIHLKGLAPAGRLDIDSTGLFVLTQDGRVARKLIGEDSGVEKEYLVRVEGALCSGGLELLRHGLLLDGKPLKPARVEWLNDDQLRFILTEGKKRQIRRMCEQVGLTVTALKRVRIGAVRLGDLPLGRWRYLRQNERF
ncbi:MAG: pseudouridine synthase [Zoogloeaceae bacterium]|jgi:23S rRNA pseudouridine2604 synthase|nr:pseudouridine synthase [Zoogloeaceae bacterium]